MEVIVTDDNFDQILASGQLVMVDFWASWCAPCRALAPVISEISKEYEGRLVVGKYNVDSDSVLASRLGIRSIPTVIFFRNGEMVDYSVGLVGKPKLTEKIDALL